MSALVQNGLVRVPVNMPGFMEARVEESQWEFSKKWEYGTTYYLLTRRTPEYKHPVVYRLDKAHWEQLRPILNPDICP